LATASQTNVLLLLLKFIACKTDFEKPFAIKLGSKFAIEALLMIPPRLKHVATLPCEIFGSFFY